MQARLKPRERLIAAKKAMGAGDRPVLESYAQTL
jgi:hypothetical protein